MQDKLENIILKSGLIFTHLKKNTFKLGSYKEFGKDSEILCKINFLSIIDM